MALTKSCALFLWMTALFGCSMSTSYRVGDENGWNANGTDYKEWAKGKKFKVGDTLVFIYDPQCDNVIRVNKKDYETCTCSSPLDIYDTGHDLIKIRDAKDYYFICSFPGHCEVGQKVAISTTNDNCGCDFNTSSTRSSYTRHGVALILVVSSFVLAIQFHW